MLNRLTLGFITLTALTAADFDWKLPQGFPRPVVPKDNPMSATKVELGRRLFYDKRMSINGKQSCGSCHQQAFAFTDGLARARGATGQLHPRSSMSLVNVAYARYLTWANTSIRLLEEQALIPMLSEQPVELGLKGQEQQFLDEVRHDPVYQRLFPQAFAGADDVYTLANVTRAIAAFERTIISVRSPYDRYRWGGDTSAISEAAKRGEIIFNSSERGGCFQCHGGWNFGGAIRYEGQDEPSGDLAHGFFNTGVVVYAAPNRGLYEQTHRTDDMGLFRVPSLRNVAITAPYMHDGSLPTLDAVLEHYAAGGKNENPNKSHILHPLRLTDEDKRDLIEFLKSLTDPEVVRDPRWSDPWVAGAH